MNSTVAALISIALVLIAYLVAFAFGYGALRRGQSEMERRITVMENMLGDSNGESNLMPRREALRLHDENRVTADRLASRMDNLAGRVEQMLNHGGTT